MCFVILYIFKQAKIRAGVQVEERRDITAAGRMEQTTTTTITTTACSCFCKHTTQKSVPFFLATGGRELQANIISLNNMDHEEFNSDQEVLERDQDEVEEAAKSPPLSVKQLLLRRGLATLVMVLILGAGILINKMVVKLLK